MLRSNKIDPGYVQFSIEHGTEMATLSAQDFRTAMRECDMLRAEREVWANIAQERNDLRDEVERLHKEKFKLVEQFATERSTVERLVRATEQWEAENERLRAAMWEAIRLCAAGQTDDAADMLQQTLEHPD